MQAVSVDSSMSSLTTPPRPRVVVPGLKSSMSDLAQTLGCSGLQTPPQSAHESRRPSVQSSWSETPYSTNTSQFDCSVPSTPVYQGQTGHESFFNAWPEFEEPGLIVPRQAQSQDLVHPVFSGHGYDTQSSLTVQRYPDSLRENQAQIYGLRLNSELAASGAWCQSGQPSPIFPTQGSCLSPELFPTSNGLVSQNVFTRSAFPDVNSTRMELCNEFSFGAAEPIHSFEPLTGSLLDQPQVVEPSQLTPEHSYNQSSFGSYSGPDFDSSSMVQSFAPASDFDSFEMLPPPSPDHEYYHPLDEDGYVPLKFEQPTYRIGIRRSNVSSSCSRSRIAKRHRSDKPDVFHRHEAAGVDVECAGTPFSLEPGAGRRGSKPAKAHCCEFVGPNGERCRSGFLRSEHLKRHRTSHSSDRIFSCPLPGCGKSFSRSDNTCDHFKTHLQAKTRGKRNPHFDWPFVRDMIQRECQPKQAQQILRNLTKWVVNGMPGAKKTSECRTPDYSEDNRSVIVETGGDRIRR